MSSLSDDCQLYCRTAEHVASKKELIDEDPGELSLRMKYLPEGHLKAFVKLNDCALTTPRTPGELSLCMKYLPKGHLQAFVKLNDCALPAHCTSNSSSECASSCDVTVSKGSNEIPTTVVDDDTSYPCSKSFAPIKLNNSSNNKRTEDRPIDIMKLRDRYDEHFKNYKKCPTHLWKDQLIKYDQTFEAVFERYAQIEGVPINRVIIMHNGDFIRPKDTPASLNLPYLGREHTFAGMISETDVDHDKLAYQTRIMPIKIWARLTGRFDGEVVQQQTTVSDQDVA